MPRDQRCVVRRLGARRHGHQFPDTEKRFKDAESIALLAEAAWRVRAAGWGTGNIGSTVNAQAAKMAPHILAIRQRIGHALLLPIERVSVKAKTAEKMGPAGSGEAMEVCAICLLVRPAA